MDGKDVLCGQALPKQRDGLHSKVSYKRLGEGKFVWPQARDGVMRLTRIELEALFDGVDWTRVVDRKIARPAAAN